jgi:hypothetical protein
MREAIHASLRTWFFVTGIGTSKRARTRESAWMQTRPRRKLRKRSSLRGRHAFDPMDELAANTRDFKRDENCVRSLHALNAIKPAFISAN